MVPTTRSLPPHHDSSGKNSKPPSYYPGYYIAAQLEAAHGGDLKQQPSRFPRRLAMADEDNAVGRRRRRRQGKEEAAGTSSLGAGGGGGGDDEDGSDKDWLRLGLGAMASSSSTTSSSSFGGDTDGATVPAPVAALDLFGGDKLGVGIMNRPPLFPLPIRSYHCQYGHDRYRPTTGASGSVTPAPPFLPFARPLRSCSADVLMRVVSPPQPRTEAAGLWLTLQAAPNQVREPVLPQIPKSYLRIRDSNMKVEVVLKYLAEKLGLAQSQQVELTCRGHLLPPFLLMKHVRDSIWCGSPAASTEDEAALAELPSRRSPGATATDHVMTLFYSTTRNH